MKRILPFVLAFAMMAGSTTLRAQNFDNAGEYMSYIGKQQDNISKKFMSYASASAHGKRAKKVENLRSKLLDEVQEGKMNVGSMPSFKGSKAYRDTAVSFMKLYYNVLNDDYSKIINLEDVAEQSYDEMEAYMMAKEMVDKKLEEGNERMKIAQQKFADENNIRLTATESELGNMMKEVHEMNQYYKVIYLYFFKPYKQEVYLMEAMAKGNITGIEQNKNSLLKYAQEGLEKLNAEKGYKGDNSLLNTCKNILTFYTKEADKIGAASDYFLTKERFDQIKKDYDKKSSHSKEDVDNYNKAVNDINKASQAFNSTNKSLDEMRKQALDNWNSTEKDFFDNHTPHYK